MSISCGNREPSIVGVEVLPPVDDAIDWFSGVCGRTSFRLSADFVNLAVFLAIEVGFVSRLRLAFDLSWPDCEYIKLLKHGTKEEIRCIFDDN